MDLSPTGEQQQIIDTVRQILERNGNPLRSKELLKGDAYDHELDRKLDEAGFLEILEIGPMEAALATLEIAKAAGTVAFAAGAIVAAKLLGANPKVPVALARLPADFQVRFAAHARLMLIDTGEEAAVLELAEGDALPVDNDHLGWPMGRLKPGLADKARRLGPGSGEILRRWWRLALALETVGTIEGAFDLTLEYIKTREQFGHPLGQFQALQHRMAELCVQAEGARWIALEAAFRDAHPMNAATAAGRAAAVAELAARESHQMHGAMGLTREYPLHLWTRRLGPLAVEMGGPAQHRQAAAKLRFTKDMIDQRKAWWQ